MEDLKNRTVPIISFQVEIFPLCLKGDRGGFLMRQAKNELSEA